MSPTKSFLGIRFWTGTAEQLLQEADQLGGLITVPSAPSLAEMGGDVFLKTAYQESDWSVVDGGYVALILRFIFQQRIPRISGLQILQKLLGVDAERAIPTEDRRILWVMPSAEEAGRVENLTRGLGLPAHLQQFHIAPYYRRNEDYQDPVLAEAVIDFKPDWIILGIGGGKQEKLGLCLRNRFRQDNPGNDQPRLVILCTGGAIAFLTGGQARIPTWADRLYLGWAIRVLDNPRVFLARYWKAAWAFPWTLWQCREDLFHNPSGAPKDPRVSLGKMDGRGVSSITPTLANSTNRITHP